MPIKYPRTVVVRIDAALDGALQDKATQLDCQTSDVVRAACRYLVGGRDDIPGVNDNSTFDEMIAAERDYSRTRNV